MDPLLDTLSRIDGVVPDPSLLIVESQSEFLESIPRTLRAAMPEVAFDVCESHDDGHSRLQAGHYHAVLSDVWSAEAGHYSLLRRAQTLSCPVPVVLSEKTGHTHTLSAALTFGALDTIHFSVSTKESDVSRVLRRALWLYRLRLTIYNRRQRLNEYVPRHSRFSETMSDQRRQIMHRALRDIEHINRTCEQTVKQIESSLRVLETISHQFENDVRDRALRTMRLP